MKNIDVYLDLDRVVLRRTGNVDFKRRTEFEIALHSLGFLVWCIENIRCYWLPYRVSVIILCSWWQIIKILNRTSICSAAYARQVCPNNVCFTQVTNVSSWLNPEVLAALIDVRCYTNNRQVSVHRFTLLWTDLRQFLHRI